MAELPGRFARRLGDGGTFDLEAGSIGLQLFDLVRNLRQRAMSGRSMRSSQSSAAQLVTNIWARSTGGSGVSSRS